MNPSEYLIHKNAKIALNYFHAMAQILESRGMADEGFSFELSLLAQEFGKYHMAANHQNEKGMYQVAASGWEQSGPWVKAQDSALANIMKLAPKFGFTPVDFENLGEIVRQPDQPKTELEEMMG